MHPITFPKGAFKILVREISLWTWNLTVNCRATLAGKGEEWLADTSY